MPPHERNPYRSKQPNRKAFRLRHIVKVKPQPGSYKFYDKKNKPIYTGSSKQLGPKKLDGGQIDNKHPGRLLDEFYRRGDVRTVPGKSEMIKKAKKFDVQYGNNIYDNRERERQEKAGLPYNKR